MVINIYYGGRGLIGDSSIYICDKITEVLNELRVSVKKYNLFEEKNSITMLPKTLKEADGIIISTNIEWFGIGGYLLQFLDSCWLYGDKQKISNLFMMPIVTSNTLGEDDAYLFLQKAWKILGGKVCTGISTYVENHTEFELNLDFAKKIETMAEDLYRVINKNQIVFPSSETTIHNNTILANDFPLTPQENEQLSVYISNDNYIKKQKEDIAELAQIFREKLNETSGDIDFIKMLTSHFSPEEGFFAKYLIEFSDIGKNLIIEVEPSNLRCYYGELGEADVYARTTREIFEKITLGKLTFQGAFMSGDIIAKGNFKILRTFDALFDFSKHKV